MTSAPEAAPQVRNWSTRRDRKNARLAKAAAFAQGRIIRPDKIVEALETLIESGDRVALEGDNQKQADFLSRSLAKVDAKKIHDLHLLISSISRPSI